MNAEPELTELTELKFEVPEERRKLFAVLRATILAEHGPALAEAATPTPFRLLHLDGVRVRLRIEKEEDGNTLMVSLLSQDYTAVIDYRLQSTERGTLLFCRAYVTYFHQGLNARLIQSRSALRHWLDMKLLSLRPSESSQAA